jgi:hypothetical protein
MRHRLVLVAAVAMLGGLTLSGCQRDPAVAARVDGEVITEAQVDQIFNDSPPQTLASASPTSGPAAPSGSAGITRADVVKTLVLDKLCENLRAKEQFRVAAVTPDQIAARDNVAATSPYAIQEAKTESCVSGAVATATPAKPTDEEVIDIYNRAKAAGIVDKPLSEIKEGLSADSGVQQYIGLKHALDRVIKSGSIELNPRYRGLDFALNDLGTGIPLIVSTMGGHGSDAIQPS